MRLRRPGPVLLGALLGVVGAVGVSLVLPASDVDVGPAVLAVSAHPTVSTDAGTTADLGSIGRVVIDTHDAPVALRLAMREIHPDVLSAVLTEDPDVAPSATEEGSIAAFDPDALRAGVAGYLVVLVSLGVAGGAGLAAVVTRRRKAAVAGGLSALGLFVVLGTLTAATFRVDPDAQLHFEGPLTLAPTVYDDVLVRYDDFVSQVGDLTTQFATLQQRVAHGPPLVGSGDAEAAVRVLVVSDLHLNQAGATMARQLARTYDVDVVVNLGDETDWGTEAESALLLTPEDFGGVPYLWVRGNHDSADTQRHVQESGATVLDDSVVTVAGVTFYGIGDPTFTPRKSQEVIDSGEQEVKKRWSAEEFRPRYRAAKRASGGIDVLLVHDETMVSALRKGEGPPLILSGHRHSYTDHELRGSRSVRIGSTGGAGLRSFDRPGNSNPNQAAIFYLDRSTGRPTGYDLFTFRPLDRNRFTMQRVLVPQVKPGPVATSQPPSVPEEQEQPG